MSCYSCSADFGIFTKEIGCEACGFSFCSRCCKKRELPEGFKKTCLACFAKSTGDQAMDTNTSPPSAHKKRMAALSKRSFSVDSASHVTLKTQWSNKKDQELADRLQRLKKERIKDDLPSESDIAERLAKLKGMDPEKYKAPPIQVFVPSDKRSTTEQANDLMKQYKEEVDLDAKNVTPEDEIAARLAALKGEHAPKKPEEIDVSAYANQSEDMDLESAHALLEKESQSLGKMTLKEVEELAGDVNYKRMLERMKEEREKFKTEGADEETDEVEADKLIERLLATNMDDVEELESLNEQDMASASDKDAQSEEFPWCVICSEDAKIRCFGCDQDLYCMQCFKECHDSDELKSHKTCPFLPPTNPSV